MANDVGIKGLTFNIKADSDNAVKGLNNLAKSLTELSKPLTTTLTKNMQNLTKAVEGFTPLAGIVNDFASALDNLSTQLIVLNNSLPSDLPERIKALKKALKGGGQQTLNIFNDPQAAQAAQAASETPAESGMTDVESEVTTATKKVNLLGKALVTTGKGFSDLGKDTMKATKALLGFAGTKVLNSLKSVLKPISDMKTRITGLARAVARVGFYRLIRGIIKQFTDGIKVGIENLYYFSQAFDTQFHKSMDMGATSLLYFRNSIGALVEPIINAVMPAIDAMVDKIVEGMNYLSEMFASFTGADTYTVAKKYAVAYKETADSAKKASEDIKRYVLGFDELNILGKTDNNTGSNDKNALDYTKMFETKMVEKQSQNVFENFKRLIQQKDWYGVGKYAADLFNKGFKKLDLPKLGGKLGEMVDSALKTTRGFLENTDFMQMGIELGQALNNFFEKVDLSDLGHIVARRITALFELAVGFLTTADFGTIAKEFSDGIKAFLDDMIDFLVDTDFATIGADIGGNLGEGFMGIDFIGIADRLWKAFVLALKATFDTVMGTIAGLIIDLFDIDLYDSYGNEKSVWEIAGDIGWGFLKGIGDVFKGIWDWVKSNIVDPIANAIKDLFGIHSPSTVMAEYGRNIGQGLIDGILGVFAAFGGVFAWAKANLVDPIKSAFEGIGSWIKDAIEGIKLEAAGEMPAYDNSPIYVTPPQEWIDKQENPAGIKKRGATGLGFSVAGHASGGIINHKAFIGAYNNTLHSVGESGTEAILPLSNHTGWMNDLASIVNSQRGMDNLVLAEAIANQTEILKEQVSMLDDIRNKDTNVTISTHEVSTAMQRQNLRSGKTVIPVG